MNISQKFLHICMLFIVVHAVWCCPLDGISDTSGGLKNVVLYIASGVEEKFDGETKDADRGIFEKVVGTVGSFLP